MDLSVQIKTKEKRERQPNWTEAEKQLLLSLTRMHQVILENKGSDTMTLKRKSDAWDEIATNMQAAGYQRTKERLKQQLGRIRAAEAKKVKDALAKGLAATVGMPACSTQSMDECLLREDNVSSSQKRHSMPIITSTAMVSFERRSDTMPTPLQEEIQIKIEKTTHLDDYEEDVPPSEDLPKVSAVESSPQSYERFVTERCSGSTKISPLLHMQSMMEQDICTGVAVGGSGDITASTSNESCLQQPSTSSSVVKCCGTELQQYVASSSAGGLVSVNRKKRKIRLALSGIAPSTRAQRVRQLHLYRIAVERERLRTLRLQQHRDRVLYRKDMQIQNLKLQILRNLASQNRNNHINL